MKSCGDGRGRGQGCREIAPLQPLDTGQLTILAYFTFSFKFQFPLQAPEGEQALETVIS